MAFQIRECTIEDATAIQQLNAQEMGYEYSVEDTRMKLKKLCNSNQDKIFVAVIENQVVGYAHANDYEVLYASSMKNIMGIAVSSRHRKQGIGKALLIAVEEWAKETGAQGIRLVSGATRSGAHAFYQQCGYTGGKQQVNFKKFF